MAQPSFEFDIDEVTLAAARRGDLGACERIYRQFQKPAFTVAVRVVKCRELAQEVTQESFITAFRKIRQFRGEAPFWAWLKRVVINHAITAIRRMPDAEIVTLEDYRAAQPGAEEAVSLAMDLEAALAHLTDEDRAIVWMHDVEGYRHRDIARLFGKTESFSKTRLARARKRLRELIGPQGREEAMASALAGTKT